MPTPATPITLITGARRGLGLGTARALAARGHHVILTARDAASLQAEVDSLRRAGHHAEGRSLDVASDASVQAAFEAILVDHGRVDVLINNAGAIFESGASKTLEPSAQVLLHAFDNNALSAYRTIQKVLPGMNERGYGRIVNVTSGMGSLSEMGAGHPAYRVSKTAQNAITRLAAHEARGDVKVVGVCPGWVRTDMGGPSATRSLEEGVEGIVWAATLPSDGPSGGLFRDGAPIPW